MRAENSIKPIIPVGKQVNTCMILEVTIARKCCLKGPDWELALQWSFEQFTFTFFSHRSEEGRGEKLCFSLY